MRTRAPLFLFLAATLSAPLLAQDGGQIKLPGLRSLTVTGEYRLRFENALNYDLMSNKTDDRDFFGQRFRLGFNAEVNEDLSAVVVFQDVRNWGVETSTVDGSADMFDVRQAFMQWRNTPLGGTAKIGRQKISLGDQRLVGGLEWANQGRAFDGVRHTWKKDDSYTVDFFVTQLAEMVPSPTYADSNFLGVYATIDRWNDRELDLYWLLLQDEQTVAGGNEVRSTVGFRYEEHVDALEIGVEAAAQFGEQDGADVDLGDVYALHAHATWGFGGEIKPYAKVEGNYATGDDPNTPENERFKNLFPTAHMHWGMMDFALWENMMHGLIEFGMKPTDKSKLALTFHTFKSVEETDRFVGPVGKIGTAAAGSSNDIGNEIDVFYNIVFDSKPAKTWLQLGYGVFLPGSGAKAAVGDDDIAHFFYVMSGLKF